MLPIWKKRSTQWLREDLFVAPSFWVREKFVIDVRKELDISTPENVRVVF